MELSRYLELLDQGEAFFIDALSTLNETSASEPSLLPGWERRTVAAHVARNADALVNLCNWARTGVETPMYPSPEAREEAIASSAEAGLDDVLEDVRSASSRLRQALFSLPDGAWEAKVRAGQGRVVAAEKIPWMRSKEVWIHAVDLDAGPVFADLPLALVVELLSDIFRTWESRQITPDFRIVTSNGSFGAGSSTVRGELCDAAAWLTGRSGPERLVFEGPIPSISSWL